MKNVLISFLIIVCGSASAQWTSLKGPGGGTIPMPSFAVRDNGANPDDIFVYSGENVYHSENEGLTWTETAANGLPLTNNATLAVSGNYLFAAVSAYSNDGLFVSSDNGDNWTPANNGLPAMGFFKSLAVSGNNLFAASAYYQGVYVSSNNGQSWTSANTGLLNMNVNCLLADGNNLYAGTGNGIYVTSNNGQSWTSVSNGIPANVKIYSLTKNNAGLFALVENSSSYERVYFSSDNGANWTMVVNGFPSYMNGGIRMLATDGVNVYAGCDGGGIYKTSDNGQNWSQSNTGLTGNFATLIRALLVHDGKIYAGTNQKGIYTSTDFAATWQKSNMGLSSTSATAMALIGDSLITGTGGGLGIFFYDRTGQTWSTGTTTNEIYATNTYAIGVKGNSIFVGETNGLFVSHDRGHTWAKDLSVGNYINAIVIKNDTIYLGLDNTTNPGVLRSTDNGATWVPINNGMTTNRVSCLAVNGQELYAGTSSPGGVFKSSDNGLNWTAVNNGITDLSIKSIFWHNNHLYAGTGGSPTGGLFISSDGAQTWNAVSTSSGITNLNVRSFTAAGTTVFAAVNTGTTADAGIYMTNDNGNSWTYLNPGRHKAVNSLFVDNNFLYAGTASGGVIKTPLATVGISAQSKIETALSIFPNPAKSCIYVNTPADFIDAELIVSDLTGQTVLIGKVYGPVTRINISELPSGMYFVRIQKAGKNFTGKFIRE